MPVWCFRQAELLNFTNWRLAANAASPLHIGYQPNVTFFFFEAGLIRSVTYSWAMRSVVGAFGLFQAARQSCNVRCPVWSIATAPVRETWPMFLFAQCTRPWRFCSRQLY